MSPEEILTSECLHSLRSSSHADKLDVSEHLLQVVGAGAQSEMVENILTQLLDVRVHQPHLVTSLTPEVLQEVQKYHVMVEVDSNVECKCLNLIDLRI